MSLKIPAVATTEGDHLMSKTGLAEGRLDLLEAGVRQQICGFIEDSFGNEASAALDWQRSERTMERQTTGTAISIDCCSARLK
jgi:hypothetical protein